jgi:hypothetical protein
VTYPEEHYYATIIGDGWQSSERWQFGLRIRSVGLTTPTDMALSISDSVESWWRGTAPFGAATDYQAVSAVRLTEVKVAHIGLDGLYKPGVDSYSHYYLPPIAGPGTRETGTVPQDTFCATLTTNKARGLASKGRIFLPPSGIMEPGLDGRVTASTALQVANSVWLLIKEINANEIVDNVMIYSKGKGVKVENVEKKRYEWTYPTVGEGNPVTGVRVGRVIDTQRRRRRQLVEAYEADTT